MKIEILKNIVGQDDDIQFIMLVLMICLAVAGILLLIGVNISAIKNDRKDFVKQYWVELDAFDRVLSVIMMCPAWIYHYIRFVIKSKSTTKSTLD